VGEVNGAKTPKSAMKININFRPHPLEDFSIIEYDRGQEPSKLIGQSEFRVEGLLARLFPRLQPESRGVEKTFKLADILVKRKILLGHPQLVMTFSNVLCTIVEDTVGAHDFIVFQFSVHQAVKVQGFLSPFVLTLIDAGGVELQHIPVGNNTTDGNKKVVLNYDCRFANYRQESDQFPAIINLVARVELPTQIGFCFNC
jgi:hypothetical protein